MLHQQHQQQQQYKMKIKYEGGQDGQQTRTQATHPTTPVIDSNDKIGPTGVRLCEINSVGCIFGGFLCENKFYYHPNDAFDHYFNATFNDNYFPSPGMLFSIILYTGIRLTIIKMIDLFLVFLMFLMGNSECFDRYWIVLDVFYKMDNLIVF